MTFVMSYALIGDRWSDTIVMLNASGNTPSPYGNSLSDPRVLLYRIESLADSDYNDFSGTYNS